MFNLGKHAFDPQFAFSSKELKKALTRISKNDGDLCLDLPCGNGRNIFLLASHFRQVIGFDTNQAYLDNIIAVLPQYNCEHKIATVRIDLESAIPDMLEKAGFVCIIHYYEPLFIKKIIDRMRTGSFLYIETPGCFGDNYLALSTKPEIDALLTGMTILSYKETFCKNLADGERRLSFKTLIQKNNG
jgi:SAM-dependent methyltransferase